MKIKVLKVRIADQYLQKDQNTIDEFLGNHEIVKVETAFVQEDCFWSVILYFNEAKTIASKSTIKDPKAVKYSAEDETLNNDEIKILDALKL